ncbi:tigger transposable element-derived protein [Plakobranchus ocellatus]|uniref:Tigger transposable element-derived protein n=1 Tax=Plakobranchus ocellatus TaxID=259542 RepID=A0AAV3ZQJ6_9GAST|nr:tigger transposable element-derived protein [Plakobranchus ocellatus]
MVSQEKGSTVTFCGAVNAVGNSIPPFLIFPRVNVQEHWEMMSPPGTKCDGHLKATGWMTSENFHQFLQHFERHAKPTASRPVLLILDNHASHCSEAVITFCKENHITLLSFPPHCSHEMKPLDVSVYGPFQNFYDYAIEKWCKDPQNAGKQMSIHSVPQMVSYAFPKAFTPTNIMAGFRATGIFPMDRNIFPDNKFLPTYSTDKPEPVVLPPNQPPTSSAKHPQNQPSTSSAEHPQNQPSTSSAEQSQNQPFTSSPSQPTLQGSFLLKKFAPSPKWLLGLRAKNNAKQGSQQFLPSLLKSNRVVLEMLWWLRLLIRKGNLIMTLTMMTRRTLLSSPFWRVWIRWRKRPAK